MNKSYQDVAEDARRMRSEMAARGIQEGEDIFYLSQVLAFLLMDTQASRISEHLTPKNRFILRKLRASLELMNKVFKVF
jgi:hypothetical protein